MHDEIPEPELPLTPEQEAAVAALPAGYIDAVDAAIVAFLQGRRFTKVARVVGEIMRSDLDAPGIPDIFYSSRVRALAARGLLESKGNLMFMRFSEVRLVHPDQKD